jgi:hypothetical protein
MNAENPVQIDLFGVSATRTKDTRLAAQSGSRVCEPGIRSSRPLRCAGLDPAEVVACK